MAGSQAICDSRSRLNHIIYVVIALLAVAPAVRADDMPQFQVGLNGGYRMGGSLEDEATGDDRDLDEASSFAVSLELRYRKGDDRFYQLWYSRQSSSVSDGIENHGVDVEYLHLGGTLPFGGWEHAQPYFAAGLGATRFSSSAPGADDVTRFSGSMASAWKFRSRRMRRSGSRRAATQLSSTRVLLSSASRTTATASAASSRAARRSSRPKRSPEF